MKNLFCIYLLLQMLSCDFSQRQASNTSLPEGKQDPTNNLLSQLDAAPAYDPNGYVNTAFGYSVPVLANLKLVSAQQMNSLIFIDALTESKTDMIIIIPFTESIEEMAQQLQAVGTPFQRVSGGITFSVQQPGVANMSGSYAASPYGNGGLGAIRIITGEATISGNTVNTLFSSVRFYQPQASVEQQKALLVADIERQKQSNREDAWVGMLRDQMTVCPF